MQRIADIAKPLIQSMCNTKGTFHYYGTYGRLPHENVLQLGYVTIIQGGLNRTLITFFQDAQLLFTVQLLTATPPSGSQSLCTARAF